MSKAYLEITLAIDDADRSTAAGVYNKYKQPFLAEVKGALSKELLLRDDDVQVLHGFDSAENAGRYLETAMFANDIVGELSPLLKADPDIRIYTLVG